MEELEQLAWFPELGSQQFRSKLELHNLERLGRRRLGRQEHKQERKLVHRQELVHSKLEQLELRKLGQHRQEQHKLERRRLGLVHSSHCDGGDDGTSLASRDGDDQERHSSLELVHSRPEPVRKTLELRSHRLGQSRQW